MFPPPLDNGFFINPFKTAHTTLPSFFPQTAAHRRYKGALARLPMSILTGERTWPMAGQTALRLATKLTE